MSKRDSKSVEAYLERRNKPGTTPEIEELVFDHTTGQLVVTTTPSLEELVATEIADQGFF